MQRIEYPRESGLMVMKLNRHYHEGGYGVLLAYSNLNHDGAAGAGVVCATRGLLGGAQNDHILLLCGVQKDQGLKCTEN